MEVRMKTYLMIAGAMLLCAGGAARAQTPAPEAASVATTEAARAAITRAEDAWRKARIDGDIAFLEQFYAKEGRIQAMDGKVKSRADDIAIFATGQIKPKFIDHGPLDITVYGQTAVVTGVDHLGGTAFGHYGEMYLRFTDVLVMRDGRWQLVVQQATTATGF
jgi:ketosteroid isomerase-like protein